jgi:hypothetical protein
MPGYGMRPLITSNDYRFIASIRDKLPYRSTGDPPWYALLLNPISNSRPTAGVSPAVEEIYERLQEWQEDENNASKAQLFVSTVRLYVENRLWDLLATDPMIMHKPTLADLIQSLRTAHNHGERPFEEPPFQALLGHAALRDSAPFYKIINKAHHRLLAVTPHEGGEVAKSFKEIDRLLRSCSASYARFMGRLTREDKDLYITVLPPLPDRPTLNNAAIPLLGDISVRNHADKMTVTDENLNRCEVSRLEDQIVVAVADSAGENLAYLKRLGGEISPGIRILENVGMGGGALAVAMTADAGSDGISTLQMLWRVQGTFRHLN